jgi:hypothetical protein
MVDSNQQLILEVKELVRNTEKHIPNSKNLKRGFQGEKAVEEILDELDCEYLRSKIVWGRTENKSSEMDFIVYYKSNIILLEVKNWYGKIISFDSEKWIISNHDYKSKKITHRTNPVHTIGRYRTDIHDYLFRNGIAIRKKDIISIVVFIREQFQITYDREHASTKLLKLNELEEFMKNIMEGSMLYSTYNFLSNLPTWDKVILEDGTYIYGKIKSNIISFDDEDDQISLNDIEYILFYNNQTSSFIKTKKGDFLRRKINFGIFRINVTPKMPLEKIKLILLNSSLYSISKLQDIK